MDAASTTISLSDVYEWHNYPRSYEDPVQTDSREIRRAHHAHRGRPRPGAPLRETRLRRLALTVSRNKTILRAEARTDGVFPLITNLEKTSRKEILLIYKDQPYVEKRYALFKTELGVAPVYLKKPNRAAGLIHATSGSTVKGIF